MERQKQELKNMKFFYTSKHNDGTYVTFRPSANLNLSSIQSSPAISLYSLPQNNTKIPNTKKSSPFLSGEYHRTQDGPFLPIQPKKRKPKSNFVENSKTLLLKKDSLRKDTDFYPLLEEHIQL